jgi:hypothetical protein
MFPIYATPEFVRAEQSYRLEGFRRWSRRRDTSGSVSVDYTPPKEKGRRRRVAIRPAVGR